MAKSIVEELTEQLRTIQKAHVQVRLDPNATPQQQDKAARAVSKAEAALLDAIRDDLKEGTAKVDSLTARINKNTARIEKELAGLKRTTALVKQAADVIKLSADVVKLVP